MARGSLAVALRRAFVLLSLSVIALVTASCQGGSNLPSISRTIAPSGRPTQTVSRTTSTTTSTSTETSTETSAETSTRTATSPTQKSSKQAAGSGDSPASATWLVWGLVALAIIAAVVLLMRRASSRRAAAEEATRRAVQGYTDGMALRDIAAVMPMSAVTDRARLFGELTSKLERVIRTFDALAVDPELMEIRPQIEGVQLSLGTLRGALRAQVQAREMDLAILDDRLADLDGALQALRDSLRPPAMRPTTG